MRHLPRGVRAGGDVQRGSGVPPHVPPGLHSSVDEEQGHLPAVQSSDRAGVGANVSGRRHGLVRICAAQVRRDFVNLTTYEIARRKIEKNRVRCCRFRTKKNCLLLAEAPCSFLFVFFP